MAATTDAADVRFAEAQSLVREAMKLLNRADDLTELELTDRRKRESRNGLKAIEAAVVFQEEINQMLDAWEVN